MLQPSPLLNMQLLEPRERSQAEARLVSAEARLVSAVTGCSRACLRRGALKGTVPCDRLGPKLQCSCPCTCRHLPSDPNTPWPPRCCNALVADRRLPVPQEPLCLHTHSECALVCTSRTAQGPLLLQLHIQKARFCMTLLIQCDTAALLGSSSGRMSLVQIPHAVTTSHWMWQYNSRNLQLRHKETKEETEEVIGST